MNMTVEQVRARLRRGEALSEIARELPNIPELRLKVLEIVQWKQRKKGLEPQMLVRYTCCDCTRRQSTVRSAPRASRRSTTGAPPRPRRLTSICICGH
jgi:hypothetical protein